jgi:hypothetical protein
MNTETQIYKATWNGITLEIRYCPDWSSAFRAAFGAALAHIEIKSVEPENAPLPITDTGYRSHFTAAHLIEQAGGPVACVLTWLDDEARSPLWLAKEITRRQLDLFS